MKKFLYSTAAVALLAASAPAVFAEGHNPAYSNQMNQKSYISWADAAAEADKYLAAHTAEIEAEAAKDASVTSAKAALDAFNASGYAGHDYQDKKAQLEAAYNNAFSSAKSTTYAKYRQQTEEQYIAAAKAQGNYYDETAKEANRTNDQRIADDIEANTGKKPEAKDTTTTDAADKGKDAADADVAGKDADKASKPASKEEAKKSEAKAKNAKSASKASNKAETKTLPKTSAVK